VSGERSWGADTVALGRAHDGAAPQPPSRRRPPRRPRRRLPGPANRTIVLTSVGALALVALIVLIGGGSGSPSAPIPKVANPAPQVVVKSPTLPRRREQRHNRKADLERQPKGQHEGGEREAPKAPTTTHEQAEPEPEPAPVAEAEPEPAPIVEAVHEPLTEPTPTKPAVEFGL
jgi:hypothetical protein